MNRAFPTRDGWYYEGQLYPTKGAAIGHMKDDQKLTWTEIASLFPGGTKSNCASAYRHWQQSHRAPY